MNTQEREQLTRFLQQLVQARVEVKDAEADGLVEEACRRQPDARYLLVQRCVLLEQAVQNAQAEIARLQREREAVRPSGASFLNSNAWGNSLAPTSMPAPLMPSAASAPSTVPQASAAPWGGGVLGAVATTAAGVVAGSFLFQGIEHLIGHHDKPAALSSDSNHLAAMTPYANEARPVADLDSGSMGDLDAIVPTDSDLNSL